MSKRTPVSATVERHINAPPELGPNSWSTKPEVMVADRGRRFSFKVPGRSGPTWSYELRPEAGGTVVTETVRQDVASPLPIRLLQKRAGVIDRSVDLARSMAITLERLDAAVQHSTEPTESSS